MDNPPPAADSDDLYGDRAASNGASAHGAGVPPPEPDPAALFILLDALRLTAPPELQDRLTALIREALLTLRALIDHYLERIDAPPGDRKVEDIPID
jgi:hypothetical protein